VFRISRASETEKERLLTTAREAPVSSPHLMNVTDGLLGKLPSGFAHDVSCSEIGRGRHVFLASCEAFRRWEEFHLGWVQVVNPTAKIVPGQLVGVEAHTAGLWSVNFSRVVEVVDSPDRFGFMYTTTALHVEEGEERFVIQIDAKSESVSYLLEAISRPRHILARIGYPFSRAMQHRFARDSHARVRSCVHGG
jgi:uncharacterized protein (UPF0548 family)